MKQTTEHQTTNKQLFRKLELPANACAGHFPDRPLVPGVLQLILLAKALGAGIGEPLAVAAIPRLRFRRPVLPADTLNLEATATGTSWRARLTANGTVVCDGSLLLEPRPPLAPVVTDSPAALDGVPAAAACLPHRAPMLLVDRLLERREDGGICLGSVGAESPLAQAGLIPAVAAVEVAAQAMGWLEAAAHPLDGPPRQGYLVAISDARFLVASFPPDSSLRTEVKRTQWVSPMCRAEARISIADHEIATATLTTWADL